MSFLLSASQLAELAQMPRTEPRDASQLAAERMNTLMAEIRALGHIPRCSKRGSVENRLYGRLNKAKVRGKLSESQLAELAEIPRCSSEPVRKRRRVLNDESDAGAAQPSEHRCPGSAFRSVVVWRRPASAASCGVGSASQPAKF